MARPKKENVEYFPHDVDMRNDLKIKSLRNEFGLEGYAIWCMVLEHLGNCNYFEYEWTSLNIKLLAADIGITTDKLANFIEHCMDLQLLQIENNYLTCDKFSDRLVEAFKNKRLDFDMENSKRKSLRNGNPTETEFTERKPHFNYVNDNINPQSKVKESKVKESKVKERESKEKERESKENESKIDKSVEDLFSDFPQLINY
jgi:hypothetical protein